MAKTLVQRSLESRVRELEGRVSELEYDNGSAREGWAKLYAVLFPKAIDGPDLGMHISGTVQTCIASAKWLRAAAGVAKGDNCKQAD